MNDEQIVELYFARSERAISETDIKFGRYCITIAYNILRNNEDSEVCKNDTYMKAWNAIPPKKPDNLRAFLGRIARNLALNMYEHMHRKKRDVNSTEAILDELSECIPDPNSNAERISESMELRDSINAFLGTLSEDNRKIFVRRYWYASSVEDIARDYGFSLSKVKTSLMRTRNNLKKHLESEGIVV
ncbi:MAG: RNA polymerase sigma factor [Oscillospiraceae bacterium]